MILNPLTQRRPRRSDSHSDELQDVLAEFEPAASELVAQRRLQRRTDSKFVLPATCLADVLEPLAGAYDVVFADGAPLASYETLYYDTADLRCFHDHRRGCRPRHKIRFRHYPDRELTFLEVKTKRSELLTTKHRAERAYGTSELTAADYEHIRAHCDVPPEALRPQVWTNFSRITLVGRDSEERVTIDTELELIRDSEVEFLRNVVVMEVKQAPFCYTTPVMLSLRRNGRRRVSASKYCTANVLLRRDLRMNRLRPAMRLIESLRT